MNNLNTIMVEGNLVRDPELKHTPKGTAVCTFSIATNRFFKIEDGFEKEVSFFDVTSWSQCAERCKRKLRKGYGVRISGRLKQDRWKGMDGKNRSKIYIIAQTVDFKPVFSKDKEKADVNHTKELGLKTAASF
jgi:single-strand DNA-binding protein